MRTVIASEQQAAGDRISDEEIVTRIVDGDTALFEMLMRRHNQRVYRTVRAILGDDTDAEDVMQQAWLSAFRHLRQFAGDARFSTWLTKIAVNEALLRRRKRGAAFVEGDEAIMLRVVDERTPDPEQQASNAELRDVMEREVAALPDAYRLVLVMREIEGLSTTETAEAIGVSEDVVKTRLHRARGMLREGLFRRAGGSLPSVFAFGNERCDRIVAAVMSQIG
jgi:RNA polymerase sigma-70 factor (ECF subfamily)